MRHTPGTWKIAEGNFIYALQDDGKSNRFSLTIYPGIDCNQEEIRANARLIAAAPEYDELARLIAAKPAEVQAIMKKHGFIIDNLDDRWQKFAFTLYTMIVELAEKAENIIAKTEGRGE